MKICTKCNQEKDLSCFSKRGLKHHSWCKVCKREYDNNYYKDSDRRKKYLKEHSFNRSLEASQYIWDFLKENPCSLCGESDPIVLEFDHIDPQTKDFNISIMRGMSLENIKKEIDKCRVLCANCHRRWTAEQRGYYKNINK